MTNFIKDKFGIKTEDTKDTLIKEEPVKIIKLKNTIVKEGKSETLKELSNTLNYIKQKFDEIYEKEKKKKEK